MKIQQSKADGFDATQLRETLDSPGYALLARRIQQAIAHNQAQLEVSDSWENTRYRQGFLAGLRCALEIPVTMHKEIAKRTEVK